MVRKSWWAWLRSAEPARLRAAWVAAVSLLSAVGVTVSTTVDARVGAVIAAFGVVLALVQGEWTRAGVISPETHALALRAAQGSRRPSPPGSGLGAAGGGPVA